MKYTLIKLMEQDDGFKLTTEDFPRERVEQVQQPFTLPGSFNLYYDSANIEKGKKKLIKFAIKHFEKKAKRYNFLLQEINEITKELI